MSPDLENAILNNMEYDMLSHNNPLPPPLPPLLRPKRKTPLATKIVAGFGLSLLGMVTLAVFGAGASKPGPRGATDSAYVKTIATPQKIATKCHGYSGSDGHWHLNVASWSYDEMQEMTKIAKQLNANDPTLHESSGSVAAILDQFQCAGMTHDAAVTQLFKFNARVNDIANNPNSQARKDLMDGAASGKYNVSPPKGNQ
jgi:hypothetical protein